MDNLKKKEHKQSWKSNSEGPKDITPVETKGEQKQEEV